MLTKDTVKRMLQARVPDGMVLCHVCHGWGILYMAPTLECTGQDATSFTYTLTSQIVHCNRCDGKGYHGKPELID